MSIIFTVEEQFTHVSQDEDHSSRTARVSIGAIGKTFEGSRRLQKLRMSQSDEKSLPMSFSSISMDTEHSSYGNSQNRSNFNTPYQGSYGAYNIFDYPSPQMPYEISMHEDEQYPPTWVNPNYPIYGLSVGRNKSIYTWHMNNYLLNYDTTVSWQNYCYNQKVVLSYAFEPPRNSF